MAVQIGIMDIRRFGPKYRTALQSVEARYPTATIMVVKDQGRVWCHVTGFGVDASALDIERFAKSQFAAVPPLYLAEIGRMGNWGMEWSRVRGGATTEAQARAAAKAEMARFRFTEYRLIVAD